VRKKLKGASEFCKNVADKDPDHNALTTIYEVVLDATISRQVKLNIV